MKILPTWIVIFVLLHSHLALGMGEESIIRPIQLAASDQDLAIGNGIPNRGYLDSFHSTIGGWHHDPHLGSRELLQTVYALRLTKTEELLRARKGYLELLSPGDEYAPYTPVPREVKNIFLNGDRKILQIEHLVRQLEEEGTVRPASERIDNRKKVLTTLNVKAISLSQMDRLIRFLSREIFEDNPSYGRMLEELAIKHKTIISNPDWIVYKNYTKASKILRQRLRKKFNISELLENILAQRTALLNQYPLLGAKITDDENCELYQCLYRKLSTALHLPDLRVKMSSAHIDFATAEGIDLDATYQKQAERNLELLSQKKDVAYYFTAPIFDRGIRVALHGNFEFLKQLNSQSYFWDHREPYFLLALNEKNWQQLGNGRTFFWIHPEVFAKGEAELMALVKEQGDQQKLIARYLQYISWGLIGAGAIVWPIGWAGVGVMVTTRTVSLTFLILSGASDGLKAYLDHINHERYGELAQQLYVADIKQGYYGVQKDYRLIAEQDYREVAYAVGNFVLLATGPLFKASQYLFRPIIKAGEKTLALSRERIVFLRGKISALKHSALAKFAYYRQLIHRSEQTLHTGKVPHNLEHLLAQNAKKSGMSVKAIKALVTNHPLLSKAWDKIKLIPQSDFVRRELMVKLVAVVASEVLVRQDKFIEEFPHVLFNALFALGGKLILTAQTHHAKIPIWPDPGKPFIFKTFFRNSVKNIKQLAIPIMWVAGLLNGGVLLHQSLIKGEEITQEDVMKRMETFFWIMLYSLQSPMRSQLTKKKINPAIDRLYRHYPRRHSQLDIKKGTANASKWSEDIKISVAIADNMIGMISMSYLLRTRGIQSNETVYQFPPWPLGEEMVYIYNESNQKNAHYLFPVILGSGSGSGSGADSGSVTPVKKNKS